MAGPVRARRLTDEEGRTRLRIVRRGRHGMIKVRRAMMILVSSWATLTRRSPRWSRPIRTPSAM